jgi:hypothetical protein
MNKLLWLFFSAFVGCGAFNGQIPYNGPNGILPVVGLETRLTADPCGPYDNERCLRDHGLGYVINPDSCPIKLTIDCNDDFTFYPDMIVPARTTQRFIVDSSTTRCWVREYTVLDR